MSNEMIVFKLPEMTQMAEAIAQSGLFGMKSWQQALALMLVAQSEGMHPATVTQDYDIIQGKAARKTHSVLARFQQMGGSVEWHELTDSVADATFSHPKGGKLRISWTIEMAKKAGLTGKDNWRNYPRAMLRSRVIAEGVRAIFPAAIGGMMVSEEAQDIAATQTESKSEAVRPVEKDMGAAQVVTESRPALEQYPREKFDQNLPAWRKLVQAGKKTPDEIISMIESMHVLTDEQKFAIDDLAVIYEGVTHEAA